MNKVNNNSVNPVSSVRKNAGEVSHGGHGEHGGGMSEGLPKGWVEITISEYAITSESKGDEGRIPYLEIGDIDIMSKNYKLKDKPSVKGCKTTNKNDILISRVRPTRGAITVVKNDDTFVSSAFTILRFSEEVESKTIFYQLAYNKDFLNYLGENCTGTMYPTVSEQIIKDYILKLPPLNEQKRIVAKLDAIMPRIEAVKARLDKVPGILKRFRQSVLTAAVTGKLTEQWRLSACTAQAGEVHPEVESQIETLEQSIPDTWKLALAKDCCDHITKGTTPKNGGFSANGIPFLKVYNIVDNKIDFDYKPQFVTEEIHKTFLKRSIVYPGTVIMNIVGPPLGKVAIIPDSYPEWNLNQAIAIFRPQKYLINDFLYLILTEGFCLKQILIDTRGVVGQSNLSLDQCQNLEIPLPPVEEQKEIVRQVDKLFALADKVEAHYQKAKARVDKLSQSVLAKAFRGELVPQDPNDLPAAELLKQILAEKDKMAAQLKKRKTKNVKQRK